MDIILTIVQDWTLHDVLYLNTSSETSSIIQYPVSRHTETLTNFILDRIMLNQSPSNQNIEDAANRIYQELLPFINVIVSILIVLSYGFVKILDLPKSKFYHICFFFLLN